MDLVTIDAITHLNSNIPEVLNHSCLLPVPGFEEAANPTGMFRFQHVPEPIPECAVTRHTDLRRPEM